jgi:hypothetical protein
MTKSHYVRKPYSRHIQERRHIDRASPSSRLILQSHRSPISIDVRRAMLERVTYLISGWDSYATNPRRVLRVRVSYF